MNFSTHNDFFLPGSPLKFTLQPKGRERVLSFDSSQSECPVPFQSAQAALGELLAHRTDRIEMINHTEPMRLLNRLDERVGFEVQELPDGRFKIHFFLKK